MLKTGLHVEKFQDQESSLHQAIITGQLYFHNFGSTEF